MLHPYQQRWVHSKSRFKVGMFARQTGKTFCTTLDIVLSALLAESRGRRENWVILSRGERQAKLALDEGIKLHCKAMQLGFESMGYEWQTESAAFKVFEVVLPGGSRIMALPANPDTARGFSANVFLDEFSRHQDSHEIWTALFPVISAGHRMVVTSTPNGKSNKFYDLMTDPEAAAIWDRHTVDIYQAVAEGLPRDIDELRAGLSDADGWAQEYELDWLDGASAWLDYDLIDSAEDDSAGIPENYGGGFCYIGNDIARHAHLWVAWVSEMVGDVLWTRELVELSRESFATQDATLDDLMRRYNVVRLCMDETGIGLKPVEDAGKRYGRNRVEGVKFTQPGKLHLATLGKDAFEGARIRIPAGNRELRTDLHSLKRIATPAGNVRFDSDVSEIGHGDRTWAAFLSIYAASAGYQPLTYDPVVTGGAHPMDRPVRASSGFRTIKGAY